MQVEVPNQEEMIGRNSSEKAAKSVQLASMSRKSANWQLWAEKVQTGQDGILRNWTRERTCLEQSTTKEGQNCHFA